MKRYTQLIIIKIVVIVILSLGLCFACIFGKYWLAIIPFAAIIYCAYSLYKTQMQTVKDTQRLINGIQFSELNLSFQTSKQKGLSGELADQFEKAIERFNNRLINRESEVAFFELLLNRIDFAIIVSNQSNQIVWINKSALDLFGKPQPKHIEDLRLVSPELPQTFDNMRSKDIKSISIDSDQSTLNLALTMISANIRGEQVKIFSIKNIQPIIDQTESEAWKKLIRILTHEMMNSITPIISLAETFSEQHDTDNIEMMGKAMQTIHRRSKSLVQFVNNYQQLARIPNPDLKTFRLAEMIEDISHLLKAQNINFEYTINPTLSIIKADRGQIEQVLINLIKNAWQACSHTSSPQIQLNAEMDAYQRPIISISDNGEGILPEVLDKVFIPFFTTKKEGSGIGLSICRQIVNAHGGSITVASTPEKGTTFTIRL